MICIAWGGMPSYAACAIAQFVAVSTEPVRLIGTPSDVPRTCSESIGGEVIHWVQDEDSRSVYDVLGEVPRVLVVSGWFIPSFNHFVAETKKAGGKVIVLLDHRWKFSLRTLLWAFHVRFSRVRQFDGFMVPGRSGMRLLRYAGVPRQKIASGLYTADPRVFHDGAALEQREKRIIFVGRLDARKNILPFVEVFLDFVQAHPDWYLDCFGCGNMKEQLLRLAGRGDGHVLVHDFMQSEELAQRYRRSRVMVLPSLEDHWGVVVHEATLCGCALLLSREVGAAEDLCTQVNGRVFKPTSRGEMMSALQDVAQWDDSTWHAAHEESLRLAQTISPAAFASSLTTLIEGRS